MTTARLPELADRRVLLEAADPSAARASADGLRAAGFEVEVCDGRGPGGRGCPLPQGRGCPLLSRAAWVVSALPAGDLDIAAAVRRSRGEERVAVLPPDAGAEAGLDAVRRLRSRRARIVRRLFRPGEGPPLLVRAVEPGDAPIFKRFDDGLSQRSRRLRYLSYMPPLSPELLARMTDVDFVDRLAFVALGGRGESRQVTADARLYRDADQSQEAEMAIVVADDVQAKGLGSFLVDLLLAVATERGFAAVLAEVRFDNDRMARLLTRAGFRREHTDLGIVRYRWRPAGSPEPTL